MTTLHIFTSSVLVVLLCSARARAVMVFALYTQFITTSSSIGLGTMGRSIQGATKLRNWQNFLQDLNTNEIIAISEVLFNKNIGPNILLILLIQFYFNFS